MVKRAMNNNKLKFCILFCILYVTQLTEGKVAHRRDGDHGTKANLIDSEDNEKDGKCWISLQGEGFFKQMSELDQKYKEIREAYAREVDTKHFDKRMLDAMTFTRGIAERTIQRFRGRANIIPAGLNLGSYCMVRMPGSMLFFYRLKLRNDTRFIVNYIHNDVNDFTLTMRLSLNDLHLVGQYERALTSKEDPSRLYYRPNNGEVEFLLKDVKYKVEGRYRMLDDRLRIEHIISQIPPMEIMMTYADDTATKYIPLDYTVLQDYLERMQNDLDLWLKDYFNDFLMLYGFEEAQRNMKMQEYENEKTKILNQYADKVLVILNERVRKLGPTLIMPDFTLTAVNGMIIKLYDGTVRGVDSMFRRSVSTGKLENFLPAGDVRHLDADIGFSGLKAEYRYDTLVKTGMPPLTGSLVLNADDIFAHMALRVVSYKPSTADLQMSFLRYGKPETLILEGPANRVVANFDHLLEHHIITIMSTTLIHHIRTLSSLIRCVPLLPTKDGETNTVDDSEDDITTPMQPYDYNPTGPPQNTDDDDDTEITQNTDNDDGPTEPSQYNDDDSTPTPPDDEETSQLPDDDVPTDPPPYTEDNEPENSNEPTEPSENDNYNDVSTPAEYDEPTTPSGDDDVPTSSDDDDVTTAAPTDEDYDVPTAPIEIDGGQTAPPGNSDENDNTEPRLDTENDDKTDNTRNQKPEYGFAKKESIELELPPNPGSLKGDSFKIDHNVNFTLTKLNHKDGEIGEELSGTDDDGPTEPSQYNDDDSTPTPPDDEETSQLPDDDVPTDPPPYTEDNEPENSNEPTEPSENDNYNDVSTPAEYDEPTTPSGDDDVPTSSDNDDETTVAPTDEDYDGPTALIENDGRQTAPADNSDENDNTAPRLDTENDDEADNTGNQKPKYGFAKKESIEIELPPNPGSLKGDSFKIDHNINFTLTKLNHKDGEISPEVNNGEILEPRKKVNRGSIS